jgi:hypothetical protein
MFDGDADGWVDTLIATFDEPLGASSAVSPWQLSNAPSGSTVASAYTSGGTAVVTLEEGVGAADTAVGSFTVALTAGAGGVTDAAGNPASFAPTAPADEAGPVAVSFGSFDSDHSSGNGRLQSGDYVEVQFSEPLAPTWTAPLAGTVTLKGGNGSAADTIDIANVSRGAFSTGRNDYITGNASIATFASTVTLPATSKVRVTLGSCSGACASITKPGSGLTGWSFLPSPMLRDAAGNVPDGTVSDTKRFF